MRKDFIFLSLICLSLTGCVGISNDSSVDNSVDSSVASSVDNSGDSSGGSSEIHERDKTAIASGIDKAVEYKGIYDNMKDIKTGRYRSLLASAFVSMLADSNEGATYDYEDSYDFLGNYCYLNCGDFMDFEIGDFYGDHVKNGCIATYDTDNFLLVLGSVKDYQLDGWQLVYDLYTYRTKMIRYDSGVELEVLTINSDGTIDGSTDSLDISYKGSDIIFKDDKNKWVIDNRNYRFIFKGEDMTFSGTPLSSDIKYKGTQYHLRSFVGAECVGVGSVGFSMDMSESLAGVDSVLNLLSALHNNDNANAISDICDSLGGILSSNIPVIGDIDDASGGSLGKEFGEALYEEYQLLTGNYDTTETDPSQNDSFKNMIFSDYVGAISSFSVSVDRLPSEWDKIKHKKLNLDDYELYSDEFYDAMAYNTIIDRVLQYDNEHGVDISK